MTFSAVAKVRFYAKKQTPDYVSSRHVRLPLLKKSATPRKLYNRMRRRILIWDQGLNRPQRPVQVKLLTATVEPGTQGSTEMQLRCGEIGE